MSPGSTLRIVTGPRSGTSVLSASRPRDEDAHCPGVVAFVEDHLIRLEVLDLAELGQAFLRFGRELGSKPRVVEHGDDRGVIVHCASMHLGPMRGECHQVGGRGPFGPVAGRGSRSRCEARPLAPRRRR